MDDYFGVNQVLENLKDDKGGQSVAADEDKVSVRIKSTSFNK